MPKKTIPEELSNAVGVHLIRWEFVRRNKSFILSYKPLQNSLKSKTFDLNELKKACSYPPQEGNALLMNALIKGFGGVDSMNEHYEQYRKLCIEWDLVVLLDLDLNPLEFFEKIYSAEYSRFQAIRLHGIVALAMCNIVRTFADNFMRKSADLSIPVTGLFSLTPQDISKYLNLLIKLNAPKSVVMKWVDFLYEAANSSKKKNRNDFDKYVQYLNVYDLRQGGKEFIDIALDLYPAESKTTGASMEDNIRRQYNTCLSIINGGYRQIR